MQNSRISNSRMSNSKNRNTAPLNEAVVKIIIAVILLVLTVWLCASRDKFIANTCVNLPDPEDTVSEFFDALKEGRYEDCDALLGNYATLGLTSSTDTVIGEQLFALLGESYRYQLFDSSSTPVIVSPADAPSASDAAYLITYSSNTDAEQLNAALAQSGTYGKNAYQTVSFTYLDISSMSEDLHKLVTEIAYGYAYAAIDVNNEETANMVVQEALDALAADIQKYYRTEIFIIKLEYTDGQWKIILDEALYKAIIGNIA